MVIVVFILSGQVVDKGMMDYTKQFMKNGIMIWSKKLKYLTKYHV